MNRNNTIATVLARLAEHDELTEFAARLRPDAEPLETLALLAWNVIAEPGDSTAKALVASLGAVDALHVAETGPAALGAMQNTRALQEAAARFRPRADVGVIAASLRTANRTDAALVLPGDAAWPVGIDDLGAHAPLVLWARGNHAGAPLAATTVALVGARAATRYGTEVAHTLAEQLTSHGLTIVSGGAYGIDAAAHRAATRAGGATVAYLAGGIDRLYPEGNRSLFDEILQTGAIYSETACGAAPTKWRFLARNRLIAASAATVVVEAGQRSGSLNTAGHAAALARPLGAVPGPVTSSTSAGCHRLLREYDAACITSGADVLELLGEGSGELFAAPADPRITRVLDALSTRTARATRDVAARSGLSERDTNSLLALLELEGKVTVRADGWVLA